MRQCDWIRSGLFFFHFLFMFYNVLQKVDRGNVWLLQPSVALYFIFMVSNVSDVAIYLHLIFFSLVKWINQPIKWWTYPLNLWKNAYLFKFGLCTVWALLRFSWIHGFIFLVSTIFGHSVMVYFPYNSSTAKLLLSSVHYEQIWVTRPHFWTNMWFENDFDWKR